MSITISGSGAITGASTSYSFDQAVSIAGTVTYEDVSNVDSVGVITARNSIIVQGNPAEVRIQHTGNGSYSRLISDSNNKLNIYTGGGPHLAMVIDQNQRVAIGTVTEGYADYADNLTIADTADCGLTIRSGISSQGNIYFSDGTSGTDEYEGIIQYLHSVNAMAFGVADGVERMRIDSSGRVGINTTAFADSATALYIKNGATGNEHTFFDIECNTNESCRVRFSEDGSTYPGEIRYTTLAHELQFYVSSAQRMFIDNTGRIGINTDTFNDAAEAMRVNGPSGQADTMLTIKSNNNGTGHSILNFGDDDFNEGRIRYDHSNNSMDFFVNDAESVSIDSNNNVYMGDPADYGNSNYGQTSGNGNFLFRRDSGSSGGAVILTTDSDNGWANMYLNRFDWDTSDDSRFINFFKNGVSISSIELNGAGTQIAYNTGSDYRLKENVVSLTGAIDRLKQLQPKSFNLIDDPENNPIDGFLAHEASTVVPYAVTGTKDQMRVEEDGSEVPAMQGMDYGKVTPLLTAALQEAISEIESLKARVDALEAN